MKLKFFLSIFTLSVFTSQAQIVRQWVASFNGTGDFNDRYTCVTTDVNGNILIGGSTTNNGTDRDYLIVKLNASGSVLWSRQYSGSGLSTDEITAITSDASGNVYVTGFAKGLNTSEDYLTIKYNSNGDTLWTRSYDFVTEYDQANSIAVDAAGNVYVTGQSDQDPTYITNDDYATVKYNSSGAFQWVQRFNNSTGNAIDRAIKVAADGSGNVYVTGRSNNGSDDDFVTIKYNSSGAQQWIKYDDRGGRDRATAMTIDASANIYITGQSDNGNNIDFWTIKYNSAGNLQWQKVYDYLEDDNATSIAVDGSGNVFVTGQSDVDASPIINFDYQTVAYSSSGNQLWENRYSGVGGNDDLANSISVSGGNVFVTGLSDTDASTSVRNNMVTVSYASNNGNQNWVTSFAGSPDYDDAGNAVVFTSSGCVSVGYSEGSNGQRNAVAAQYNLSGAEQWVQNFNGIGDNNDNIRALAIDNSDNVYAAGYSVEKGKNRDMAMVKFSNSGTYICSNTYDGSSVGSADDAQSIALDNTGNPFIAGFSKNKGSSNDLTWLKFNSNCDTLFSVKSDGPGHGSDKIYDMVKDGSGNFYITGRVDADPLETANDNCFTAKVDPSGNVLWSAQYNSSGSNEDRGASVRVAASGNVYVTGRSWNGNDLDILLIKYNNAGAQQWIQTYNGGNGNDQGRELAFDASENIYVCGIAEETTDSVYDYVTLKYDNSGTMLWDKKYNGTGNGDDKAVAIAVDGNSNAIITGQSDQDPSVTINYDMVTIEYDSNGNLVWGNIYNGTSNLEDAGDDVAINPANQVYITGHTNSGSSLIPRYDVIALITDLNGNNLWSDIYNSSTDSSDVPNLILLNGNDFYVAGSSIEGNEMRNMMVIKYTGTVLGINEQGYNADFSIFPNPFSVNLTVKALNNVTGFELWNTIGEKVAEQKIVIGTNSIQLPTVSSGIYFFRITDNNQIVAAGKICKN